MTNATNLRRAADGLDALAERCEAATGPDRQLDVEIALAQADRFFDAGPRYEGVENRIGMIADDGARSVPGNGPLMLVPSYTTSLDAALTLVPESDAFTVGQNVHYRHWVASINYLDDDGAPRSRAGSNCAATPALALCAAALRARHLTDTSEAPTISENGRDG